MKTKIKRHGRSVISVILAVCLLISCMTVGLIATDAAKVTGDEELGATNYYFWYNTNNDKKPSGMTSFGMMTESDGTYRASFTCTNSNFWFIINSELSLSESVLSNTTVTTTAGTVNNSFNQDYSEDYNGSSVTYDVIGGSSSSQTTIYITYNPTKNTVLISSEGYGDGGGSGGDETDYDKLQLYGNFKYGTTTVTDWSTKVDMTYDHTTTSGSDTWDYYYIDLAKSYTHYFRFYYNGQDDAHDFSPQNNNADVTVPTDGTEVGSWRVNNSKAFTFDPDTTEYTLWAKIKRNDDDGLTLWLEKTTFPTAASLSISASPTELSAVGDTSTITVTATDIARGLTNLTYTIYDRDNDSVVGTQSVTDGSTSVTFTVTPDARVKSYYASVKPTSNDQQALYDEVWTSADATVSNSADEYIPRYTVTFSSNDDTKGTVTAKTGDGTALTSGAKVKEGTSVIFTATPKAGNIFMSWTGIDSTATTVTRIIREATTVTGNFGAKGYKIVYQGNYPGKGTMPDMRELPNGRYISATTFNSEFWFQIYRNSDGAVAQWRYNNDGYNFNDYYDEVNNPYKAKVSDANNSKGWMTGITSWDSNNTFRWKKSGNKPGYIVYDPSTDEIWISNDKDDLYDVKVVAKDGTIRYGYETLSDYTQVFGDTIVELVTPSTITGTIADAYDGMAVECNLKADDVRNGVKLRIKTQTKETYVNQGYYVKGFAVSGYEESFSVLWQEFEDDYADKARIDSGYNEFELTIEGYPEKNIEITPIYWIKESTEGSNIRFYVDGFAGEVYKEWDGNLAVDAFTTSGNRLFGEYPGQPMINYNGRYVVDLPRTGVTGITLNNYVWDRVHTNLFYGTSGTDDPTTQNGYLQKIQNANKQTYDFNDFVYLKQVNDLAGNDEDIIFSFRYKYDENHATTDTSNLGKSTYYKDTPSTATKDYDYRKGYSTINPNDSIYQWENLTDFYGNRVDIFNDYVDQTDTSGQSSNPKAAYTNPIRIVSNGYDYSEAGNYATAWAVYAPVDSTGNTLVPNGAYDHYALIDVFGGQGITTGNKWSSSSYLVNPTYTLNLRDKYDQEYSQDSSKEHSTSSFVFDFVKMPTVISYEYTIKNNTSNLNLEKSGTQATDGNPGLRSDGRWYVSKSDQTLKSNVIIEYAEKDDDSLYRRDYFQADGVDYTSGTAYVPTVNTGLATGIKAYFDNEDASDEGALISYQNVPGNTQAYAVSDGKHTFNLTTVGDPNGDYTFKGWYLYSNGKYSLVSRDAIYPSEATANDVYVARYYKTPSGTLNVTHELHPDSTGKGTCYAKVEVMDGTTVKYTYNETTNPIKVTNTYMKSGSANTLRITLRTVPGSLSTFEGFYKKLSDTIEVLSASGVLAGVSVDDTDSKNLKATITTTAISNFFTDGEQTVKALPFYSKLNKQEYNYTIEYLYTSRLWGDQEYVQKGTIEDDILKYFDISSDGSTCVLDNKLQEEFLSMMAPYENNFKEKVVWMFSDNSETPPEETWLNGELTIRVNSYIPAESKTLTNYYNLPYLTSLGSDKLVINKTDSSGRPIKNTAAHDQVFYSTYSKRYTLDNVDSSENFIKAEPIINKGTDDSPDLEYFQYWNVYSADGSNKLIRKCYYNEFNLTFYEAYRIEAVYDSTPTTPSSQSKTDNIQASISFLENSRNQWNYNHGGSVGTDVKPYWQLYGDRVFSDFALSFSYDDKMIKTVKNRNLKTKLVIEQLGNLSVKDAETRELDTKNNLPTPENDGTADLKTYIEEGTNLNSHKYIVQDIDKTELDNKNCIEYYYNFANVTQQNMTLEAYNKIKSTFVPTATDLRNHYYRAYAVITDGKDTVVSEPVYFTIYDMANIKNYSENAKADGGKS